MSSIALTSPGMATLHVTNGDHAAEALARAGVAGTVLPWRDVLHDGPVPDDADREAFRETRARFLESRGWTTGAEVEATFAARDAQLDGAGAADAVLLWFEPDLYDQLQLVQVLARLARRPAASRPQVHIVPADCYLGSVAPGAVATLEGARRAVTADDLSHAERAWAAFTAPEPTALVAIASGWEQGVAARTYAADAAVRLPYVGAALRRLLEEYPDVEHGLSRSERQLCELLLVERVTAADAFERAHRSAEAWAWLGDLSFAWYVERLSLAPEPLVTWRDGSRVTAPLPGADRRLFWDRPLMLAPFGRAVLRGQRDALAGNGGERWIGGVKTGAGWRWDPARGAARRVGN